MASATKQKRQPRRPPTKIRVTTTFLRTTVNRRSVPRWNTVKQEDNERLLKLWQSGATIRESQKLYVWQWFDDLCTRRIANQLNTTMAAQRAKRHRNYGAYNQQTDRILLAIEFFKAHSQRSIGWCMMAYRMRFPRLETIRYLSELGINESGVLQVDSAVNRRYTLLLQIVRQEYTMRGEIDVAHVLDRYRSLVPIRKPKTVEEVARQAARLANALSIYYPVVHLDDDNNNTTTTRG
jgi:hypothetical protein